MQRFSRKRQAILDCLRGTTTHPSAEWVYEKLKPAYPDLSLATVYRNLGQLKEAGVIRSMGTVQSFEHFDANVTPHSHAVCVGCGRIVDVWDVDIPDGLMDCARRETGFELTGQELRFTGLCAECRTQKE